MKRHGSLMMVLVFGVSLFTQACGPQPGSSITTPNPVTFENFSEDNLEDGVKSVMGEICTDANGDNECQEEEKTCTDENLNGHCDEDELQACPSGDPDDCDGNGLNDEGEDNPKTEKGTALIWGSIGAVAVGASAYIFRDDIARGFSDLGRKRIFVSQGDKTKKVEITVGGYQGGDKTVFITPPTHRSSEPRIALMTRLALSDLSVGRVKLTRKEIKTGKETAEIFVCLRARYRTNSNLIEPIKDLNAHLAFTTKYTRDDITDDPYNFKDPGNMDYESFEILCSESQRDGYWVGVVQKRGLTKHKHKLAVMRLSAKRAGFRWYREKGERQAKALMQFVNKDPIDAFRFVDPEASPLPAPPTSVDNSGPTTEEAQYSGIFKSLEVPEGNQQNQSQTCQIYNLLHLTAPDREQCDVSTGTKPGTVIYPGITI